MHTGESGHVQRIGDNDSLEAKLLFEQIRDDRRRSCGDAVWVRFKSGNREMRNHNRIHTSFDGFAKGRKLHAVQPGAVSRDLSHAEMRVSCGVAVSGKMFDCSQHSVGACASDISHNQVADLLRVFSEGTGVDDWISRVRIYISIGKEIPVHADGTCFLGGDPAECFRVVQLAVAPNAMAWGKPVAP